MARKKSVRRVQGNAGKATAYPPNYGNCGLLDTYCWGFALAATACELAVEYAILTCPQEEAPKADKPASMCTGAEGKNGRFMADATRNRLVAWRWNPLASKPGGNFAFA